MDASATALAHTSTSAYHSCLSLMNIMLWWPGSWQIGETVKGKFVPENSWESTHDNSGKI